MHWRYGVVRPKTGGWPSRPSWSRPPRIAPPASVRKNRVALSPFAGKPPEASLLVDLPALVTAYYTLRPDGTQLEQRVAFGTSGHRGRALKKSFNESHILAITQAICRYRKLQKIVGPLFLGMDTHALSMPARATALEVLAGNGVEVLI